MKSSTEWIQEYHSKHQHPTNVKIHEYCVPLIMYSLLGVMWPLSIANISITLPFVGGSLIFYFLLSWQLALGMLGASCLMLLSIQGLYTWGSGLSFWLFLSIFSISWILQIIGHKMEGERPVFLENITFLWIGPLWSLIKLYSKIGISLNMAIK